MTTDPTADQDLPMPDDRLHPTDRQLAVEVETGTGALRLDLARRLAAEALGTGLLIVAVIGSGIMATRLSPDRRSGCSCSRTPSPPPARSSG